MKIAIHHRKGSFSDRWIAYCKVNGVDYKLVNCYANDIIEQISDCDALMWHFHHTSERDVKFAKQLLYSVQAIGKKVFPDFNTAWHFDDKVGQKYLLEAIGAPMVPTYIFYSRQDALTWAKKVRWPKVFKLRGGAGSQNVKLAKNKRDGIKLINTAFGKGFKQYEAWSNLKERWRKFRLGKKAGIEVFKGILRLIHPPKFSNMMGKEIGYVYFQDFIPNNNFDVRIIVIGDKAFAIKRPVRKNDFRASGGGEIIYHKEEIDERCVKIAFEANEEIKSQSIAYDFVFDQNNNPLIVEISYGYSVAAYDDCEGYWTKDMQWHSGTHFDFCGWMVNLMLK